MIPKVAGKAPRGGRKIAPPWGQIPLGSVCRLVNGRAFKPTEWTDSGLPIVRIQNLNDESKPFNYSNGTHAQKHEVNDGDVLISWSGTPGTSFGAFIWNRGRAILNQHIFRVELDGQRVDRSFFVHAVNWRLDELIRQAHGGVGLRHITKGKLEAVDLPIPHPEDPDQSVNTQRRIAAKIRILLDEIDRARKLVADSQRDIGRMVSLVIGERFSRLSPRRRPLIDVLQEKPRNGWSPKCEGGSSGTPVLKLGAVLGFQFDSTAVKFTSLPAKPGAHYWLKDGDILISRSNTPELVGHAAVYLGSPQPCIYPDLMMRMRVRSNLAEAQFVVYWLQSREARAHIESCATGASSTMKKISQGDVSSIPFPMIELLEQRNIVAQIDSVRTKITPLAQRLDCDGSLLNTLENAILAHALQRD